MKASILTNRTFDELKVGDSASLVRIVGRDDIDLFAAVSGDAKPQLLNSARSLLRASSGRSAAAIPAANARNRRIG